MLTYIILNYIIFKNFCILFRGLKTALGLNLQQSLQYEVFVSGIFTDPILAPYSKVKIYN